VLDATTAAFERLADDKLDGVAGDGPVPVLAGRSDSVVCESVPHLCGSLAERCRVGVPIPRLSGRPRRREALGFVADLGRGRVVGALGGRRLDRVEETVVGDRFVGLVQLAEDRRERRGTVGRGPEPAVDPPATSAPFV